LTVLFLAWGQNPIKPESTTTLNIAGGLNLSALHVAGFRPSPKRLKHARAAS